MSDTPLIGIIGYGYVGKATYEFFKTKYNTIWYDPFVSGSYTQEEINQCQLGIICVMTPSHIDGSCDTSIVDSVIQWLKTPLILIKSTISPGTTDRLISQTGKSICFSPEYIGESDYDTGRHNFNKEIKNMSFVTIGGNPKIVDKILDFYLPILGPNKTYHITSAINAEIAKYMENCYLATKVVFCYEFEQICKAFNTSYNSVRECWLLDPRVESSHTAVFSKNVCPYSGKCLPKDIKAIISASKDNGYIPQFLIDVDKSNNRIGNIRK